MLAELASNLHNGCDLSSPHLDTVELGIHLDLFSFELRLLAAAFLQRGFDSADLPLGILEQETRAMDEKNGA